MFLHEQVCFLIPPPQKKTSQDSSQIIWNNFITVFDQTNRIKKKKKSVTQLTKTQQGSQSTVYKASSHSSQEEVGEERGGRDLRRNKHLSEEKLAVTDFQVTSDSDANPVLKVGNCSKKKK